MSTLTTATRLIQKTKNIANPRFLYKNYISDLDNINSASYSPAFLITK